MTTPSPTSTLSTSAPATATSIPLTPGNLLRDTITLAKRSLLKLKHNPGALVDVVLLPIIFMLMFAYLFGGSVSGSVQAYLPTIVPGIVAFALLMATSNTGTQLREDIETGVFDRFKSLPIAPLSPLTGMLTADIVRYIIASACAIAVGFLIGWRPAAGIGWVIAATLLVIFVMWCISWVFAFIGVVVKSSGTISAISTLLTMVLGFVSNAIVATDSLPDVLRVVAEHNPITYLVNAYRIMVESGTFGIEATCAVIASCAVLAISIPATFVAYKRKL
jgi:ABC-2 type transport system permease protein